jgi:hypothetical protein
MYRIAFTGLDPYTAEQGRTLADWLPGLRAQFGEVRGHHMDTTQADVSFHRQCRAFGIPRVIHPPSDAPRVLANRDDGEWPGQIGKTEVLLPQRTADIEKFLITANVLIVAPPHPSWTSALVERARRARQSIIVVFPDGTWDRPAR